MKIEHNLEIIMKEKRSYLTRSTRALPNKSKILNDNLNIKSSNSFVIVKNPCRKRSSDVNSCDSSNHSSNELLMNNFKDVIENVPPPIATRLRSSTVYKINGFRVASHNSSGGGGNHHRSDHYQCSESSSNYSDDNRSSQINNSSNNHNLTRKKSKLSLSSGSRTSSSKPGKTVFKTPSQLKKPPARARSLLKAVSSNSNQLPPNRYLLRSRSFRTHLPSPPVIDTGDSLFRAPDPPLKPLSEMYKRSIIQVPVERDGALNLSQLSDCSNNSSSCLSATLLSRFVKKRSKMLNAKSSKPWKQMRKMESSQEYNDSSSCTSIGDDSLSTSILQTDPEQKILDLCDQSQIKNWCSFFEDFGNRTSNKVGEGVYGEVFRLNRGNVLKIFPVDGDLLVNGEDQMTVEDVYPEVFVSKRLTELNGKDKYYRTSNFVQLKKASMLRGKLPQVLIDQWKQFAIDKGTDNECLDFLSDKQKWMALEYEFAGESLSNYKFNCYNEVRSIIEQISLSLAVAEAAVQFEHRDLHWLNILVKPTRQSKLRYRIKGAHYLAYCFGIFVTIIDFTVSRMCVDNNTVYMDMSDCPEIFEGEGDYQFEIYRMMKKDNNNNWREFNPRSNLYWLHYLIDKLLHETSYPRGDPSSKLIELDLNQLYNRILSYKSAQDLVDKDPYFEKCRVTSSHFLITDE